ncbi:Small ubiquitin-related modifier 2 [Elasticomyces elasticus]|nr:Small ubiquitin-related modifier 2 [Elasticomyces elasticus]KAK4970836.1 hypothetical protein LTR42_007813 [Elasticomyces elasticus]
MEYRGDFERSLELGHLDTPERARQVTVIIKDINDRDGPGMTFAVKYLSTFKNPFDHFKAACCRSCKPARDLRFKRDGTSVLQTDTPQKLGLLHNSNIIIRVYSTVPGLNCASCQATGYPKSNDIIKSGAPPPAASTLMPPPASRNRHPVSLVIQDQTGFKMSVKTYGNNMLSTVMDAYAAATVRPRHTLRFFFDNEKLMPNEMVKQYGLANDDLIEVFLDCLSG